MVLPSADQVGRLTVFNLGGNTTRLVAAIHYNRQKVYIRAILTHEEYDKGNGRGKPMPTSELERIEQVWPDLANLLFVPHTDSDYQQLVALLDSLIDRVGEDETNPLASLMEVLGALIERYEDEHVPELT
ncbi:MAG: hypothetical protein OJF49_002278 [Ktedonobacterales bacterium]|nr:MAG: hypothetical protein OJF49_002278 [Ktedonobacterales bacterium]